MAAICPISFIKAIKPIFINCFPYSFKLWKLFTPHPAFRNLSHLSLVNNLQYQLEEHTGWDTMNQSALVFTQTLKSSSLIASTIAGICCNSHHYHHSSQSCSASQMTRWCTGFGFLPQKSEMQSSIRRTFRLSTWCNQLTRVLFRSSGVCTAAQRKPQVMTFCDD